MAQYFDRYNNFKYNGKMSVLPNIKIPVEPTDKYVTYKVGSTRLDKLSNSYYNSPFYGWLIMLANPEFGGLEFLIPDQSIIRVPFPFETAIKRYTQSVNIYNTLYVGQ